jgi:secreted PhoX family phosphatase
MASYPDPPSRRAFLAAGGVGVLVLGAAAAPAEASEEPPVGPYRPNPTGRQLAFTPIEPNTVDDVVLAEGYADRVLIAWGDPVRPGAPGFDFDARPRTGRPASSATTTTTWPSSLSRGGARTASSACCGPTTSTPTRS